ncbi:MAG: GNAT family N-acetyltransferase [Planctomycetota bacterium]
MQQSAPGRRNDDPLARDVPAGITCELIENAPPAISGLVDAGLDRHNAAAAELDGVAPFTCLVRSPEGSVIGGANARRWGACCEIQQMWVDEAHRGKGLGAQLVAEVESHARRCRCTLLFLETFSFQAPEFYGRLGFETACAFAGFPGGVRKYIMRKSLD